MSCPIGLAEAVTTPPSSSSAHAVTASQGSPSAHSHRSTSHVATPQESNADDTQPLDVPVIVPQLFNNSTQREIAAYFEAGIPIAEPAAASTTQPVFTSPTHAQVPASDSPPYEFNGLFAVPSDPPATPGAPPLYQPHASEPEAFPPLSFTPFHRNAIAARAGDQVEHELPGDVSCISLPLLVFSLLTVLGPLPSLCWLSRPQRLLARRVRLFTCTLFHTTNIFSRFERFTVGGRTFFCPVHLMLRYPHWRLLLNLERPPHGWVLSATVDATIFALVIESLIAPSPFDGTEPGLSLVKLLLAARQAHDWGMEREVAKLIGSARRYVARRVFYRNPHAPDAQGVMDHTYFVHRSEDIFRAWRVASRAPRSLQRLLPPAELVCLYTLAVPRDLWPALTAEFPDEFAALIDFSARIRVVPEEVDYHEWWLRFFRLAGCLDFDWMVDVPDVLNMFFHNQQTEDPGAAEAEVSQ